jgi:glycosyltransferase involved in cell wall biosynthesis
MQSLYAASDIYLNASRVDNQPVSILEAFAAGLPVVSTAVGGIPFLVADGRNGLLADDDSYHSLAAQLRRLLEQPELVHRLVDNAHACVQHHRWDAVYARLATIYQHHQPA